MSEKAVSAWRDARNIKWGSEIPREFYCDQPYIVVTERGEWVCVMTTGQGVEGERGQHVVATISGDQGQTWSELIDIEPADGPEASWVMPLLVPGGRIYAFYTYNTDNRQDVISDSGQLISRVDTLGDLMFKYSDDDGRTWSAERYKVPIRSMAIDRNNPYGGEPQFFWGVGKPIIHQGAVYMGLAKVGSFGEGFMASSEGFFMKSINILTERDASRLEWETLPDGDYGIRAPHGRVADEHNPAGLSDGSLYCTFRTVEGHNGHAYSRDGGHTWTTSQYAEYRPGGRRIKHPRAANFVRKFSNGKFILWFHNHGRDNRATPSLAYHDRNPVWMCGGVEKDGFIHWSQPEIVLYDDDPAVRISYPDFIEDGGKYFISETQKTIARIHELDGALLEAMWGQHDIGAAVRTQRGLLFEAEAAALAGAPTALPKLPSLQNGGSFTIELWLLAGSRSAAGPLLDTRGADGKGIAVELTARGTLRLTMNDGRSESSWESDDGLLPPNRWHHAAIIVDGGPHIITMVIDGELCDGGTTRQFGWGRFSPELRDVSGGELGVIGGAGTITVGALRLYDRYLLTSEAVGHYHAGRQA